MLEIDSLSKRFGPIVAVDNLSFTVDRGEVLGFLGPNGSGKTTTMRMVTGFLQPSDGAVRVDGHDVVKEPIAVKRRIGYLPEGAPAYGDMSPRALFGFIADVRGITGAARRDAIDRSVSRLELERVVHQPIETLSKGFKRRVGLAAALLHDPDLLILDEPTDGLDPNQKHQVRELLKTMAPNKAIVISTHLLEEVNAICTRAIIIARGRMLADALPQQLEERSRWHNAVGIRVAVADADRAMSAIGALAMIESVEPVARAGGFTELVAFSSTGADALVAVRECAATNSIVVNEIYAERGRLDDVFRELTLPQLGVRRNA
ncbi:MAG: ABC transporter ATP-binding protein [Alphaproteobacteria bacterium]|nr:ABC transporter ATP-binding protein [Alphaproteobacteria bacterium]